MLNKEEIEKAIIWVEERIAYIIQNCDLQDEDNKKALDNLNAINICLQENNKLNKMIDEMLDLLGSLKLSKDIEGYEIMEKEDWKQYFEEKVEEK